MVFELAITHEDVQELKTVFDDRYVLQSDCNEKQENVNKKFANDDKRIDTLIGRMNLWNKLLWAIASASIGSLVVAFFELILK
jgi:hypothetical protein